MHKFRPSMQNWRKRILGLRKGKSGGEPYDGPPERVKDPQEPDESQPWCEDTRLHDSYYHRSILNLQHTRSGPQNDAKAQSPSETPHLIHQWQTRILKLHPDALGTALKGTLLKADITELAGLVLHDSEQHVQYEALSYCWERRGLNGSILINGVAHAITESLQHALEGLRHSASMYQNLDEAHYIWADGICINQEDVVEKSMQVANMLTIYRKAVRTVVWLGQEGARSHAAAKAFMAKYDGGPTTKGVEYDRYVRYHVQRLAEESPDMRKGLLDLFRTQWVRTEWSKPSIV